MGCSKSLRPLLEFLGIKRKTKKKRRSSSKTSQKSTNSNSVSHRLGTDRKSGYPNSEGCRQILRIDEEMSATHEVPEGETSPLRLPTTEDSLEEQQVLLDYTSSSRDDSKECNGVLVKIETEVVVEAAVSQDIERRSASVTELTHEGEKPPSQLPSIVIDESIQERRKKSVRVKDENQSSSNTCYVEPPTIPKAGFQTEGGDDDDDGDEDDFNKFQGHKKRRIKACRGVRINKSSDIVVKYTKVYGESDGAYRNDSTPRGLVFMANFTKYDGKGHLEREGSNKDFQNMLNLFHLMGYETSNRSDKYCQTGYITKDTFLKTLRDFSQATRHKMLCSCIVIIMSHGSGPKTFVTSDNQEVDLMEVYAMLDNINCQNLRGKPKIFILQFCRNGPRISPDAQSLTPSFDQSFLRLLIREEVQHALEEQYGIKPKWGEGDPVLDIDVRSPRFLTLLEKSESASVASFSSIADQTTTENAEESSYPGTRSGRESPDVIGIKTYQTDTRHVPTPAPHEGVQRFSDMYSIFSTTSGELSHRDPRKGSLLIQAICHVFAEYGYQDEIDILVRKVSLYMTKTLQKDDPIHVPRQTCERTNNGLDKYFYFNPQNIPHCRHVTI